MSDRFSISVESTWASVSLAWAVVVLRSSSIGPGRHQVDVGLTKNFYVTEARYLQFRWEMFNAPNHVNLSAPTTTINLATTGRIFSASAARQMQFGLKFIF
jgi:hypothetical protein